MPFCLCLVTGYFVKGLMLENLSTPSIIVNDPNNARHFYDHIHSDARHSGQSLG